MRIFFALATLASALLSTSCSQAQNDKGPDKGDKKKSKKESLENKLIGASIPGLKRVGSLAGSVSESSGLINAEQPGTFYTHGDAGNQPVLYKVDLKGKLLDEIKLSVPNKDWESVAKDNSGNIYVCDTGNNDNTRRDLVIYRLNPANPQQVGSINFAYADQKEFPPSKKDRNFDCEASLWHDGKIYLFTKDRAQQRTSNVYAVSDQPGRHTAQLVASMSIPGEVTDANLSPDGHSLVLLGREEMFLYKGNSLEAMLKSAPNRVALPGAGQTEGVVFYGNSLIISTEQGALYQYTLQPNQ
ncbi:NHL repeat-containing protein [Hymenobacter jejuensis]|uniref:Esterase-like activity of phytase family protein n=1 Tax=Hymenobacter jejuensis TaxID=2502781 RepID=A0A5B7ZZT4_9BACT|nr:hypothetical protein [Hymenobacter jejuensis]QDA59382.1 hypothetical protein FHG12_04355 [Hymenobacter jejuensis]